LLITIPAILALLLKTEKNLIAIPNIVALLLKIKHITIISKVALLQKHNYSNPCYSSTTSEIEINYHIPCYISTGSEKNPIAIPAIAAVLLKIK
jgi:hypothetical protein